MRLVVHISEKVLTKYLKCVSMQLCFNTVSDSNEVDSLIKRGKDTQIIRVTCNYNCLS